MNAADVRAIAENAGFGDTLLNARTDFFTALLRDAAGAEATLGLDLAAQQPAQQLDRLAKALERMALEVLAEGGDAGPLFRDAFACRRAATDAAGGGLTGLARLAGDALLGDKPTELAMLLRDLPVRALDDLGALSWPDELESRSLRAFILLARRAGGWADIHAASVDIARLRHLQAEVEARYLADAEDGDAAIIGLIARYNLARVVDLAASYLTSGRPADPLTQIDRHRANVLRLADVSGDLELRHTAELVAAGSRAMVRSSIWFATRTLGRRVREFVEGLAAEGAERPLVELWPSQRVALSGGLLDPAKRAIVAEMPTSAGKTLVAEFSIVQALALNVGSRVAYLVPTRALVNQVSRQLRRELGPLGIAVEAAVPVFELDPSESAMLQQQIDVLVTTPEKFDLLLRQGHEVARDIALVVADEAHNLGVDERGARLELLLATLKRERPEARFLLLTPFVPNAATLADWLSEDAGAALKIDWRPSERVAAAAFIRKPRGRRPRVVLQTLPSANRVDVATEVEVDLGEVVRDPAAGRAGAAVALAEKLAGRGGVLLLGNSKPQAESRAEAIAAGQVLREGSVLLEAVANLALAELGQDAVLPGLLRRGVTYHHAGLPHELRYLIELLVDHGDVRTVCGTTTLAQGVNFPIASVIVESLKVPTNRGGRRGWRDLSFEEFWNVAGRAGRALRDRVGLVAFPVASSSDVPEIRQYLQNDARNVVSALTDSLRAAAAAATEFDLALVNQHPAVGLFLQYLAHAVRVSGAQMPPDIDDLLRSSLMFHQVEAADRDLAERLVSFTRSFVEEAAGKNRGYLALADSTGFSLTSVDYLTAVSRREHPDFADPRFWEPRRLFDSGSLAALTEVVTVLGRVPELTLGQDAAGQFNPERVAGIVRDWVQGESVSAIADRWFAQERDDRERRRDAASYLFSRLVGQMPWGLGALQQLNLRADAPGDAAHVPFMVFYGVNSGDATRLRMSGVPRAITDGLVGLWRRDRPDAASFADVRSWLDRLPETSWRAGIPAGSALTAEQSKLVWRELAGVA